jgi:hypothetical protein
LPLVKHLDPVAGEFQRVDSPGVAGLHRGVDFGRRDPQRIGLEVKPVEFPGRLDQRRIAPPGHVVDNGAGSQFDIGRNLALHREKISESLGEIGAAGFEAYGHDGFPGGVSGSKAPRSMARRPLAVNPLLGWIKLTVRERVSVIPGWSREDQTRNLEIPGSRLRRDPE